MGVRLIPWLKIKDYGLAYDFDDVQMDDLIYFVRRMDQAHTKRLSDKTSSHSKIIVPPTSNRKS